MSEHPNLRLVRDALEAFGRGEMAEVQAFLSEEIVWHVPGRGKFAGDLHGVSEVFQFFSDAAGPPGTTKFSFDVRKMVGDDEYVAMFLHYHHERGQKVFDQDGVELFRIDAGKIAEFWALIRDTRAFDEFFS